MQSRSSASRATLKAPPTIFVVDGDPAVRNSLVFALGLEGYRAQAFAGASDVLALASFPDEGCFVLDPALAGIDGLEVLARLRARNVQLPAILITTDPSGGLRVRAARAGVPIIEKPLVTEALFQCIRAALAEARRPTSSID
jgi:two-component system, LuxR family, response regulator FixJ